MVVVPAAFVTERKPVANIAEFHGLRVSIRRIPGCFFEIAFNLSEEGDVMGYKKLFRHRFASEHHMHPLRLDPLDLREEF